LDIFVESLFRNNLQSISFPQKLVGLLVAAKIHQYRQAIMVEFYLHVLGNYIQAEFHELRNVKVVDVHGEIVH
jgi:hypothetical protein